MNWAAWTQATCMPDSCFCEAARDALIRQPANTVSNLAFVLVGVWLLRRPVRERDGLFRLLYGWSMVLLGIGSGWFHASLTLWGQGVDVFGMYLIPVTLSLDRAARRFSLGRTATLTWFFSLNAASVLAIWTGPGVRREAFGILLSCLLAVEIAAGALKGPASRWLWIGGGLFFAAFGIWILDSTKILCAPHSLLQGHALWHAMTAAAAGCLCLLHMEEA